MATETGPTRSQGGVSLAHWSQGIDFSVKSSPQIPPKLGRLKRRMEATREPTPLTLTAPNIQPPLQHPHRQNFIHSLHPLPQSDPHMKIGLEWPQFRIFHHNMGEGFQQISANIYNIHSTPQSRSGPSLWHPPPPSPNSRHICKDAPGQSPIIFLYGGISQLNSSSFTRATKHLGKRWSKPTRRNKHQEHLHLALAHHPFIGSSICLGTAAMEGLW